MSAMFCHRECLPRPAADAEPSPAFASVASFAAICLSLVVCLADARAVQAAPPTDGQPAKQESSTQARISVDAASHGFGTTWIDQELKHTFLVSNVGKAPLEIQKVTPDFGCSVVSEMPQALAPGASAPLTVTIDTQALQRRYEKKVVVQSNDSSRTSLTLMLRGECKPYVEVLPRSVSFGRIPPDAFRERTLTLTNHSERPFQLHLDALPPDAEFKFQLVETIKGQEYQLFVNTLPAYKPGAHRTVAIVKTDVKGQDEIKINTYALVPQRLEVNPPSISLASPPGKDSGAPHGLTKVVQVNNYATRPVQLIEAASSDPAVEVETHVVQPGRHFRVLVRLPAGYRPPAGGAGVTLKTSDPQFAVIEVPIGSGRRPSVAQANRAPKRPAKKRPALDLIGKPCPAFSLETLEGIRVSNAELEFHPATVLNFFAPNCPFCKRQIPKLEALRSEYESRGIRFVNISEKMKLDFTPDEVQEATAAMGSNLELAVDSGNQIGRRFKVTGFPCLFIVRPDGVIDHVVAGNKKNLREVVSKKLDDVLLGEAGSRPGETPSLPAPKSSTE